MSIFMTQRSSTGDAVTGAGFIFTATASTDSGNGLVEFRDGAGGVVRLRLSMGPHDTKMWKSGSPAGVRFSSGVHVTISGVDTVASISYELG